MKYIVEFEDEPCLYEDDVHFYKCIQAPWWGLSEKVIKHLTPYQPDIAPDTNVGNITNSCAHEKDHTADIGKKVEGDCISRQAAIDAVIDEFKRSPTPAIRAKLRLEALPPAQPEQRWIPCRKKLPEKVGAYLVKALMNGDIFVARWEGCYWGVKTPIIAWMPLPEPYKGGDE